MESNIDVTLVERNTNYVSCPISNRVFSGKVDLNYLTHSYEALSKNIPLKLLMILLILLVQKIKRLLLIINH